MRKKAAVTPFVYFPWPPVRLVSLEVFVRLFLFPCYILWVVVSQALLYVFGKQQAPSPQLQCWPLSAKSILHVCWCLLVITKWLCPASPVSFDSVLPALWQHLLSLQPNTAHHRCLTRSPTDLHADFKRKLVVWGFSDIFVTWYLKYHTEPER